MITTDPMDEVYPMVDENDNVIGKVLRRDANRNPKVIHRAIDVLVLNKNGELLIQKRSPTKDVFPNAWTLSVGGHVNYEDTYDSAAIRETSEEIGVDVVPGELKLLGKVLIKMPWENEYTQVYEYHLPEDIKIRKNREEISEVKFVSVQELNRMLQDKNVMWSDFARQVLRHFPL